MCSPIPLLEALLWAASSWVLDLSKVQDSHIINNLSNFMGYHSEYCFTEVEVTSPLSSPPLSSKLWKTTRFVRQDLTLVLPLLIFPVPFLSFMCMEVALGEFPP